MTTTLDKATYKRPNQYRGVTAQPQSKRFSRAKSAKRDSRHFAFQQAANSIFKYSGVALPQSCGHSIPDSTRSKEKIDAFVKPSPSPSTRKTQNKSSKDKQAPAPQKENWINENVVEVWDQYDTSACYEAKYGSDVIDDNSLILALSNDKVLKTVREEDILRLLQFWVEIVLSAAFRKATLDRQYKYPGVLWVALDEAMLPNSLALDTIQFRSGLPEETIKLILKALASWAKQGNGSHALKNLGWLIIKADRPPLVLCWDTIIPQTRLLPYWQQSMGGHIVSTNENGTYLIDLDDSEDLGSTVTYSGDDQEIRALEKGDRVRYWKDLNGKPFVCPEKYLSPYAAHQSAEWTGIDDRVYYSDSMAVG